MKKIFALNRVAGLLAATCLNIVLSVHAAGPFTVNTTTDTHAVTPASGATDSGGNISLRSAIEAANAQTGATIINVPNGTYNLTLGELDIAVNGHKTNTIIGAGSAVTIVNQTDPTNRVFNIDFNSIGSTIVAISGVTIQGGHDGADKLGGAGILAGSVTSTPKDILTLSNCVVRNNHCTTNTTQQPGGGIQMAGGDLNITSCTFSNNSSGQSFGGAIFTLAQSVVSSLNITNSLFANNSMTNSSGAGPDGGGAIMIGTPAGSLHNIIGCTFTNNRVYGISGNTYGGAIQMNGGALTITASTFVNNLASGAGGLGGAIYADSGSVNMTFCRLVGNLASTAGGALYNHASNGATTVATNDWWGCDGGPGASGCDVASTDSGALTYSPWLFITNTASPGTINMGQSTTLTASVLKNSANQTLTAAQVGVLLGLPITWSAGAHGLLGSAQTVIQPTGLATALFTNDNTCNAGVPTVTLDNGTSLGLVLVQCPDLTIAKTNNVSSTIVLGNNWTWKVHIANAGLAPATFASGNVIVLDNLPNANINYGLPSVANVSGVSGTLAPSIDPSQNLMVSASGAVTLAAGGSFDVQFSATPTVPGGFANPRSGGICMVDPNNNISESNEGNNSATDTVTVTCPTITGTVSGGTAICPGNSAIVAVTVSGGTPPYTVTLNNGGGTQVGASPLYFVVTPATTTTYQISSGTDVLGCPVNNSGSATITNNALASPTITLSPSSVLANSAGNQASVPAVYASYSWTITNGFIIGQTNQPFVTFVAGNSNKVSLGVSVVNGSGCSATSVASTPIVTGFSLHTNVVFPDGLPTTTMTMAFDGSNYWSCSGGGTTGARLARYSLTGALLATYSPGLDFRSVFTKPDGTLLARAYGNNVIYQQTSPGVFAASGISLTNGILDPQSAVVMNSAGTEFNAIISGVVCRWSTNGALIGSNVLSGFGAVSGETTYPQNGVLATMGGLWLTYNGGGILSLWNTSGSRVAQITLPGAGTSFDSDFSLSYCNGKVFIVDAAGGSWRAFDLYGAARVAVYGAPSTDSWNTDVQNKIAGTGLVPQVDAFLVNNTNPVPSLTNLLNYQAVLLYSDAGFSDTTSLGNALANYVDQGGGAALATFAFYNSTSLGIQGRLTNGYLPFTTGSQGGGVNLTLTKDVPSHPLLDGVNTFNGGSSSFYNSPITNTAGATLVAQWSDGTPLIAGKNDGFGRSAALNFYPPSSDVRSDFWVSSTDGARMMADALLWSGKIPARIVSAPADQVLASGTATFKVVAVGTAPLSYQWRLNGTNLPSATSSTLSVPVLSGNYGAYSVVVSNLYGTTTSLNALLNPPLRFLSPVISSGGTFSLFLVNADGSAMATNRAARVSLYGTTNLATPFSLWNLLTNPVVPTAGQLRADGFNATNSSARFFRSLEAP